MMSLKKSILKIQFRIRESFIEAQRDANNQWI